MSLIFQTQKALSLGRLSLPKVDFGGPAKSLLFGFSLLPRQEHHFVEFRPREGVQRSISNQLLKTGIIVGPEKNWSVLPGFYFANRDEIAGC